MRPDARLVLPGRQYIRQYTRCMVRRRDQGTGTIHPRIVHGVDRGFAGQIDLGIIDGKRRRATVYGKTRQEVIAKMAVRQRQLDEQGTLATSDPTVEKWMAYWLDEIAAERIKPNTLRSYRTAVKEHIVPSIGNIRLGKLSTQHIRSMHRAMTRRGLSSSTARNAHRILSVALNDAVRDGKVGRNVARSVRAPAKAVSDRSSLTADRAKAVLTYAESHDTDQMWSRWLPAFLLGARQGECLGLRWSSVDWAGGQVSLAWSLQRIPKGSVIPAGIEHVDLGSRLYLMPPKTKSSIRVVPLFGPLEAALRLRLAVVEAQRPHYVVDHDLVWCSPSGFPIAPRTDWQTWRDLLEACGIAGVPLHAARHTAATLLLELGVDAHVIASILGHSDVVVTRSYQHVDLSLARVALADLGERLQLD